MYLTDPQVTFLDLWMSPRSFLIECAEDNNEYNNKMGMNNQLLIIWRIWFAVDFFFSYSYINTQNEWFHFIGPFSQEEQELTRSKLLFLLLIYKYSPEFTHLLKCFCTERHGASVSILKVIYTMVGLGNLYLLRPHQHVPSSSITTLAPGLLWLSWIITYTQTIPFKNCFGYIHPCCGRTCVLLCVSHWILTKLLSPVV